MAIVARSPDEALKIAQFVGLDAETLNSGVFNSDMGITKMVIAEVIVQYTLIDQVLGEIISSYFLGVEPKMIRSSSEVAENEHIFSQQVLDEMFMLRKMGIVHAISPLPSNITSIIRKINAVRNALAHSFYPEDRKEYKSKGRVLYSGLNIRTLDGLIRFRDDANEVHREIQRRAYGH